MTTAILVAGGAGTRLGGGVPKAFRPLCGKPLLCYALQALADCDSIDTIVLVAPVEWLGQANDLLRAGSYSKPIIVVAGGAHRQDSVKAGLDAVPEDCDWVAVHDAARPFATANLFKEVIRAARAHGGAIAARRATDTLKLADHHTIEKTLDRNSIWLAETPQVFPRAGLLAALHRAGSAGKVATDEAQAMEWRGVSAYLVETHGTNLKVTTPADWAVAERLLHSLGISE